LTSSISRFEEQRVMVIIRHNAFFDVSGLFRAVINGGIHTVEISLNTPGAIDLIRKGSDLYSGEMFIGAGTVLSVDDAKRALDSGALFIVSPVFIPSLVEYCVKNDVPVFPGVTTPTEAFNAFSAGAAMVKLFPAGTFGPSYIRQIKGPLDAMGIIAVGGIDAGNVAEYLKAGADAVAIGAGVIRPQWVEHSMFDRVTDSLRNIISALEPDSPENVAKQ